MDRSTSYRDLVVWQRSLALVRNVYTSTRSFPREEMYGLTSQIRRASVSVPANIAEGQARNTKGEFLQFLGIASGSLAELETLVIVSRKLGYLPSADATQLLDKCDEVGRLLAGLKRSLERVTRN